MYTGGKTGFGYSCIGAEGFINSIPFLTCACPTTTATNNTTNTNATVAKAAVSVVSFTVGMQGHSPPSTSRTRATSLQTRVFSHSDGSVGVVVELVTAAIPAAVVDAMLLAVSLQAGRIFKSNTASDQCVAVEVDAARGDATPCRLELASSRLRPVLKLQGRYKCKYKK